MDFLYAGYGAGDCDSSLLGWGVDDVAVLACGQGSCLPRVFRRVVLAVMSAFLIVVGGMGPAAGEPLDDREVYSTWENVA